MLAQILIAGGAVAAGLLVPLIVAGQVARRRLRGRLRPAGRLVDVGGRSAHVAIDGAGPVVVFEPGIWAPGLVWQPVIDALGDAVTAVTYDRPGLGWSEPSGRPRTAAVMADELAATLSAAGVRGPAVLVGHSAGGSVARVLAVRHPELVVGLVLVDSAHEAQFERAPAPLRELQVSMARRMGPLFRVLELAGRAGLFALRPGLLPISAAGLPAGLARAWRERLAAEPGIVRTMAAEMTDLEASNAELRGLDLRLGDLPLVVLSHGRAEGVPPQLGPAVADEYERLWQELQVELAGASTRGRRRVVEGAGHEIPSERPAAVAEAIQEVLLEVAGGVRGPGRAGAGGGRADRPHGGSFLAIAGRRRRREPGSPGGPCDRRADRPLGPPKPRRPPTPSNGGTQR